MIKTIVPERLKRSESFFGLHFDFHATNDDRQIGKSLTEDLIEQLLHAANPDFLQCDCKGHAGFSSYPTKTGIPAPGIVKDTLRLWREVTANRGVSLYMHYSGVWDAEAVRRHPSWARIDAEGNIDPKCTSIFGPYVNELMIPQIQELALEYGVDGVWVDGECWATDLDYAPSVLELFANGTKLTNAAVRPGGALFDEFLEFCRNGFRSYLSHYVTEIHKTCPRFEIASNWAYTSYMPDPVSSNVDFCSGDVTPQNALNSARFEARCLAHQEKPWDLMSWGFSSKPPYDSVLSLKPPIQLMQEAAAVISQGGGYQIYFRQKRDGSVDPKQFSLMSELSQFCRERQAFCHHAQSIPQIGVILSSAEHYRHINRPFANDSAVVVRLRGIVQCLLDSQYSVDVIMDHSAENTVGSYPLIILPECGTLREGLKDILAAYVGSGGKLLCLGSAACRIFEHELGIALPEKNAEPGLIRLSFGERINGFITKCCNATLKKSVKEFGTLFAGEDLGSQSPAASIASYGKGLIAGVYFDLGEIYSRGVVGYLRDFVARLVSQLFPDPIVTVEGSHLVDVCLMRKSGKLYINLINTAGPHADCNVEVIDEIPPLGPLKITIKSQKRPKNILLEPEHLVLPFVYNDGEVSLTLPILKLHKILCVD